MRVLVADRLDAAAVARVRAAGHDVVERSGLQGAALIEALRSCHALMIRGATRVTAEVLRACPDLKVVVRAGSGLDNVDVAVARGQGVAVFNTPASNAVSVAELVFGLLLALERQLVAASSDLRDGRWERARWMGRELAGRRLGLVGFGRIAREVAMRARAFEMEVCAHDPLLERWPAGFDWVPSLSLDQLLASADVVSLHVPLSPATRNLIGEDQIARMKRDAILVNCARGGVVDEVALLSALQGGRLRGVALDVFSVEPPGDSPLLKLPNVAATPHLGASTLEAQRRAGDEAAAIVIEALAGLQAPRA